jgi:uncharacterized protein YndB with AHSA1/START domain
VASTPSEAPETAGRSKVAKHCGIACSVLLFIFLAFLLGGYALPKQFEASTSVQVDAPPAQVFPTFDTQEGIQSWWKSMAEGKDLPLPPGRFEVKAIEGPQRGEGAKVDFVLDGKVTETWEILESEAPGRVVYDIDFKIMRVRRTITLEPKDGGTFVTWAETAEIESPLMRYFSLLSNDAIVRNFSVALGGVKRLVESRPDSKPAAPGASAPPD